MSESQPEPAESDSVPETPPQIQSQQQQVEFEDIELPNNVDHKSLIEIYYKKFFYIIAVLCATVIALLFGTGLISIDFAAVLSAYSTGIGIVMFFLLWLYSERANS